LNRTTKRRFARQAQSKTVTSSQAWTSDSLTSVTAQKKTEATAEQGITDSGLLLTDVDLIDDFLQPRFHTSSIVDHPLYLFLRSAKPLTPEVKVVK
jgi:hypothetical protein